MGGLGQRIGLQAVTGRCFKRRSPAQGVDEVLVQAFYQLLATGIIIIVAMLIHKLTSWKHG